MLGRIVAIAGPSYMLMFGGDGRQQSGREHAPMRIQHLDQARTEPVDMDGAKGVSMAMMIGREHGAPNFAMRQFRVEPGGHSPRHSHDYEHEVVILDGAGEVLLEGEYRPIGPGDVVFVPADQEHQFRAGDDGLRFLCLAPVTRNCGEPTPGT